MVHDGTEMIAANANYEDLKDAVGPQAQYKALYCCWFATNGLTYNTILVNDHPDNATTPVSRFTVTATGKQLQQHVVMQLD